MANNENPAAPEQEKFASLQVLALFIFFCLCGFFLAAAFPIFFSPYYPETQDPAMTVLYASIGLISITLAAIVYVLGLRKRFPFRYGA